jgi:DNA-binding MarR family transcriptional regulator
MAKIAIKRICRMPRPKLERTKSHTKDIAESWAKERPDLDPTNYLYLIYLMRLGRILDGVDDRYWKRRHGLSGTEMRVLYALRRAGPPYARRPTDLYTALLVTSGAVTKQVDRLITRGLVKRVADSADNGGFLVCLTPAGRKIADEGFSAIARGVTHTAGHNSLSPSERIVMRTLCEKLLLELEAEWAADDTED